MAQRSATTVRDLRRSNRSRALWQVFLNGPLSRQEVASRAGLSAATVSNLVVALEAEGLLAEAGLEDSGGGRPRGLLQVNPQFGYVIGVDVGETAVLTELFDVALGLRARHSSVIELPDLDPAGAAARITEGVEAVISQAGVPPAAILGVGVAVPGIVEHGTAGRDALDTPAGAVVHGQSIGWDAVPFEALLRARISLPVLVDNGAIALGQAEQWFGAARGTGNAVIVLLGTGVGTCIISNGQVYRGATSSAGEWGHTTVMAGGRVCRCGAAGCLEAYVGAGAIRARFAELGGAAPPVRLDEQIAAILACRDHDQAAAQVTGETVTFLGAGIAGLVNLFNPERVVVGGWLGHVLVADLLPQIRAAARRQALRLPFSQVQIVPAELGQDAVALGGATLPVARLLDSGGVRPDRARAGRRAPVRPRSYL
jgi:predicted NBD/HSP70 family sugar kinase